ncbi:MAG: energy transducer TonB [Cellvibrionaceae bacterium]|nr:energy transducer TonB [Cellvibrionaceae bacterium]
MSGKHLNSWLLASLLVHGGLLAGGYSLLAAKPAPVKIAATRISLGLQAASRGSQAIAPSPAQPAELLPKPKPKPKPKPRPKPKPKPAPIKPPPKPITAATPVKLAEQKGKQGIDGSRKNNKQNETGQGQRRGAQSLVASYDSQVLQHLNRFKRYPQKLRKRRLAGVVSTQFSIDRQGNLIRAEISGRRGHRLFERAAKRQLRRAQPYPAAPPQSQWQRRHYKMDINYSVVEAE